ncbi:glycosyltransferase WbuB [Motiliproteus coralliicola]|uniref:Glycosyltransferase WbuB n=1 Tax=Motiliproteus coralliicola TaxID=2283196 RepID=A0A369WMP8_9GAMM|nr:glycosyltransferase family 4 protein [Motiliproteus coralliicola]RDE22992.1 glycosyltransferase WbuB [Motiliproteus coralliicola]
MKILLLSFYYPPDLSAGSFRTVALVRELEKRLPKGSQIDVLTTQPNRYASYSTKAPADEIRGIVSIHRVKLPPHQSGMFDQAKAFGAFYLGANRFLRGRHYDLVIATTSRLMTGFLGARIATRIGCPFYLDVRDIFIDTLNDLFKRKAFRLLLPILDRLESYTIRRADRINLISAGFVDYFSSKYALKRYDQFTNGIDEEFLAKFETATDDDFAESSSGLTVLYAGNIGAGQGLEHIIPPLAKALGSEYHFVVVGDGGRRQALQQHCENLEVSNVRIEPAVSRTELLEYYRRSDVLFLHLNDIPAFEKVLPSKIFEYAALHKPILAGVRGHAAEFLEQNVSGSWVFNPCDTATAAECLKEIATEGGGQDYSRDEFCNIYRRSSIMEQWVDAILDASSSPEPDGKLI